MGTRGALPKGPKTETITGTITPPKHLTRKARSIFVDVVSICEREGYALSPMDAPMLELYATARADALLHEQAIEKEGWTLASGANKYSYPNPRVAMRDSALKRAAGAATKLGLAKLDRARVPKTGSALKDEFDQFVK